MMSSPAPQAVRPTPATDPGPEGQPSRLRGDPGWVLDRLSLAHLALTTVAATAALFGMGAAWSALVTAVLLAAASALVQLSTSALEEAEQRAWRLMAGGAAAGAVAEAVSGLAGAVGSPLVSPSLVDLFRIAFYSFLIVGLLSLPRHEATPDTGLRTLLDAMLGTAAIGVLAWEVFLGPRLERGGPGALVSAVLDLLLLAAALLVLLRRSPYRVDRRLVALSVGLVLLVVADILVPSLTATPSGLATAPAILAVGSVAAASWELRRPQARRTHPYAQPPVWKAAIPHSAAVAMFLLFAIRVLSADAAALGLLPFGAIVVGGLLVVRQIVAARETRRIVGRERDQLLIAVSNQLRAPLTAVAGFSDVLAGRWQEIGEVERDDMLEILAVESRELADELVDLAALARDELDEVRLELRRLDGRDVIAQAIVEVWDVGSERPPVKALVEPYLEVIADHRRLVQMLRHLLVNARDYGGGRIVVVAKRTDDGRLFEIHDDGPGLEPRDEKVVWERFERGGNRLNATIRGSGLGLAIVRALAGAHGGEATYRRSERLGGGCFSIELPYDPTVDVPRG